MTHSCNTIGPQTGNVLLSSGPTLVDGILVKTDGTNNATLTLYDNTAGSGDIVFSVVVAGANRSGYFPFPNPLKTYTGLYATISGTGAEYFIYIG